MLQDKRKDLDGEKRKKLLQRLLQELSRARPDLYYQATSEVARQMQAYIKDEAPLNGEERALVAHLEPRDIEVLLSLS